MRKVKRYHKIEKLTYRKYHIKDLQVIIKLLYPYRQTINKFSRLIEKMHFTKLQKELLCNLIHSLTIINEMYREEDKWGRLYSTREDVVNAIFMLQNELELKEQSLLLSASLRWFYNQLHMYFTTEHFTSRLVANKLLKSKSTCYRYLTELVDRELVEITGKLGQSYVYALKEN